MKEGERLRRKYGRLIKKDNVIVFPGMYDRLIEQGIEAVEKQAYATAVELFEQAIHFQPDSVDFLGPFVIALYETKAYERAKKYATLLLQSGTTDYFAAMELYLAITIQLQEYEEVEKTIQTLFEEDIVPEQFKKKFQYLRELNERLAHRYGEEMGPTKARYSIEEFRQQKMGMQQVMLASLADEEIPTMTPVLLEIVADTTFSPIVQTFALVLLKQANYQKEVRVRKLEQEKMVQLSHLPLPGESTIFAQVQQQLQNLFDKDPTKLEMANGILKKYSIVAYPFEWGTDDVEVIANAYAQYIESLFSGELLTDSPLLAYIKKIDSESVESE